MARSTPSTATSLPKRRTRPCDQTAGGAVAVMSVGTALDKEADMRVTHGVSAVALGNVRSREDQRIQARSSQCRSSLRCRTLAGIVYQALYRKYRPQSWEDVVGQS